MRAQNGYVLHTIVAGFVVVGSISTGLLIASPVHDGASGQQPSAPAAVSLLKGAYTADQAARGRDNFEKHCFLCHTVAEHTGASFADKWNGMTVGEVFDLISSTMPDGNPGGLEPGQYASIIAFFLKETGYPEGKQELPSTVAELMNLKIEPVAK